MDKKNETTALNTSADLSAVTPDTKTSSQEEAAMQAALLDEPKRPWYVRMLVWAAAAAVVAGGGAYWWHLKSDAPKVSYVTQKAERGSLTVTVTADGTLNPMRTVTLGSELSGIVREVNVDVNDSVKVGQVLIELDTRNLESQVLAARASLATAEASLAQSTANLNEAQVRLRRMEELNARSGGKMPSRIELDEQRAKVQTQTAAVESSKAEIENAKAQLSDAQTDLSKAQIKSPIDGVVLARSVEPGYAVAASLQAVELLKLATDLRELELRVDVDEADIGVVQTGQPAYFTVSAYPDKRFPATLKKVAFGSTETENVVTYTAYLNVDNKDLFLRPGMTASATISTAKRDDVLLVPNSALRFKPRELEAKTGPAGMRMGPPHDNGVKRVKEETVHGEHERTVYVLRDGASEPVPVKVTAGLSDGTKTEIVSGELSAGEAVVVDQRKAGAAEASGA